MYDLLIFIGRFQPLHKGHQEVIDKALKLSKKVLVLVGSANAPRTLRNPFTYQERSNLIRMIYPEVITRPLQDHTYNDAAWMAEVQQHVKDVMLPKGAWQPDGLADFKIGLIGCNKDATSYYLDMFGSDYDSENVEFISPLNATAIREQLFSDHLPKRWFEAAVMDLRVYDFIEMFKTTEDYSKLKYMYDYIYHPGNGSRVKYGEGPFLTADTLVQVGSKILVIRRGREYGHGLLAMPGGFVEKNERFLDAAMRELREEVRLKVPEPVLRGSIVKRHVFDDPHRSERGRLVTECFHIKLVNEHGTLPKFKGSEDPNEVDEILWMDIADLRREDFFEDHFHIIRAMLGL